MNIFSEYMAQATQGDLALGLPEGDESDLDVIREEYSSGF
jgi:hypothetical protein